jgi:hypothetical protein
MSPVAACLAAIARHLFLDLLSPDDTFQHMLRKIVLTCGFLVVPYIALLLVIHVELAAREGFTLGHSVFMASGVVVAIAATGSWLYAKVTRTVPDAVMDVWATVGILGNLMLSVSSAFPQTVGLMTMALNHMMCHTPRTPFVVAFALAVWVVSAYNGAALIADPAPPPWILPGSRLGSFFDIFFNNMGSLTFAAIPVVDCYLMAKQHAAQVAAMKQAAELSQRVARHLRRYDTDAVEAELVDYRDSCAQPDAQLLENYSALVENLNQYRPHLPNWMVGQVANDDGAEEVDGTTMTAPTSDQSCGSRQSLRSRRSNGPVSPGRSAAPEHVEALVSGQRTTGTVAFAFVDFAVDAALAAPLQGGSGQCLHRRCARYRCDDPRSAAYLRRGHRAGIVERRAAHRAARSEGAAVSLPPQSRGRGGR